MLRQLALLTLAMFSLVCACSSRAQTFTTNNVTINFNTFGSLNPASIRSVTVTPMYWASVGNVIWGNPPVTVSVASQPQMTNGFAVFSNQVCAVPYQIALNGYSVLKTNYFIPATAGTNQNVTLQTAWIGQYINPGTFYYPNPVVTNVIVSGGGGTNGGTPVLAGMNITITNIGGSNQINVPAGSFDAPGAAAAIGNTSPANMTNSANSFVGTMNGNGGGLTFSNLAPTTPGQTNIMAVNHSGVPFPVPLANLPAGGGGSGMATLNGVATNAPFYRSLAHFPFINRPLNS